MKDGPAAFFLSFLVVGLLLVSMPRCAMALTPPVGTIQPAIDATGRVTVGVGAMNNSWGVTIGTNPGGTNIGKDFVMPGPGGRTAAAKVTARLTAAELALFAGRAAGAIGAAAWVGSMLYDYWQDERVQPGGASGALGRDPGQATVPFDQWCVAASGVQSASTWTGCYGTPMAAMQGLAGYFNDTNYQDGGGLKSVWSAPTVCNASGDFVDCWLRVAQCFGAGCTVGAPSNYQQVRVNKSVGAQCPAWIDFYGNNIAAGGSAIGPDGKCPSGTYAPITAEELQAIREARANAWVPEDLNELTREILGIVPIPVQDVADVEVGNVVPGSLSGPETTTTTEVGGQQVEQKEAIGWDWSRDPLRGTEGNWIETKTIFEKDANGNWQTKSTTRTQGETSGDAAKKAGDMCALNPDAAACKALGTAPEPDTIPEQEIEFEITPVSGFGPSTAACPAPRTISVSHGVQLSMPFDLLCEFADGIRPVVLAMAWIGAVFTFMGVSRREG